jgi:hypothetical protein
MCSPNDSAPLCPVCEACELDSRDYARADLTGALRCNDCEGNAWCPTCENRTDRPGEDCAACRRTLPCENEACTTWISGGQWVTGRGYCAECAAMDYSAEYAALAAGDETFPLDAAEDLNARADELRAAVLADLDQVANDRDPTPPAPAATVRRYGRLEVVGLAEWILRAA